MAGLSLQPPIKTISVLIVHLLIAHSCRAQVQLIGPRQPIVVKVGDDIMLPCHLDPAVNVAAKTLEWTRPDLKPRFVYVWRSGHDLENVKNPSYRGRTSLFTDELTKGNISLKLSKVKPSDAGRYRCFIPDMNIHAVVQLVVVSHAVSSPVIGLKGIDRDKDGVVLHCESLGWYPEPEVLWLDGEGNLLSAGPTETVRGPDDLYTVSSRVTVEKRHSNSFTCRVQQKDTNQMRETKITISDDFFNTQSSSAALITGLAAGLAVCIVMIVLLIFFFVWKWRPNIIKTKKSHRDGTDEGEEKNPSKTKKSDDPFSTGEEMELLKGKEENETKHRLQEQQRREEEVQSLKEKLETQKTEFEKQLAEVQQQLEEEKQKYENELQELRTENQKLKDDLEIKCKELEEKSKPWFSRGKNKQTSEKDKQEMENSQKEGQTLTKTQEKMEVAGFAAHMDHTLTRQDSGHISVDEVDLKGEFVRLSNKSKNDQPMGGWELHLQVNNRKPITYQFKHSFKFKAGSTVTIWASGCGLNPETSTELLWFSRTAWGTGRQLLINLYSDTGELMVREILELDNSQKKYKKINSCLTTPDFTKGNITVDAADLKGNYVRLRNISKQNQQLKDWELHIHANNRTPIICRFPNIGEIISGGTLTFWSSDNSHKQNPPTDVVWRDQKSWGTGQQLLFKLYSDTGELEARKMLESEESQSLTQETESCGPDSAKTISVMNIQGPLLPTSSSKLKTPSP